jgi:hypothetical protein
MRMKVPGKLPVILSPEEVAAVFSNTGHPQAAAVKVSGIDSARMLIRVEEGKGARVAQAFPPACLIFSQLLDGRMLLLPQEYSEIQHPRERLFPGTNAGTHIQPGVC